MHIRELNGKTVCVLGFGKEGKAMLEALRTHAPQAEVTVADKNAKAADDDASHRWQVGEGWLQNLGKFDVLIVSPGIPPLPEVETHRAKLTNSTQIFFDSIPKETLVIGVTGTKGKSTTASLLAAILKEGSKDVVLLGNIGEPAIGSLERINPSTIVVHELSSYQLRLLHSSPAIALVTSFFPEHLDYHGSVEAYRNAKRNIVAFQRPGDTVFYEASGNAQEIAGVSPGTQVSVPAEDSPVPVGATHLIGAHNQGNIALAWKAAESLGTTREAAVRAITAFKGLRHRLEALGTHHGLSWVDDAISTTPESAVAALDALGDNVRTLLLGGQDRGVDFSPLIKRLAHSSVENVLLFPGSGERIAAAMDEVQLRIAKFPVASMEEAVKLAILHTPANSIVLLSPASPSYGMFKNFEEKGDTFARCITAA